MARTNEEIAALWNDRAEDMRTVPLEQAVHHVADYGSYIGASFRKASASPTRDKVEETIAHMDGARGAMLALLARLPAIGTVEADTGPVTPPKRAGTRSHVHLRR